MGTPEFAVPSLSLLLENGLDVSSVVTVPDKKMGRGLQVHYLKIKDYAITKNLKILQPENLKDENFLNALREKKPDLIVIIAFRMLPKEVYTLPKFGSVNVHASYLPKYRGAAPINRAIING